MSNKFGSSIVNIHNTLPPKFSGGFIATAGFSDDSETLAIPSHLKSDKISGITIGITYRSSSHGGANRRITLRRIDRQEGGYFHLFAYCHEAEGIRTFRSDRILSVYDWRTGEVFAEVARYIDYLADLAEAGAGPEDDQQRALNRIVTAQPGARTVLPDRTAKMAW